MKALDPDEAPAWDRWFAVECNNRAWDVAELPNRSEEQERLMLLATYAAAFHWNQVGSPIQKARADMLLAHAHSLLGHDALALANARRYLDFCTNNECEDWDLAFAYAEMAHAAWVVGDSAEHAAHHDRARALGDAIADEDDRKVFFKEFSRIPKPCDRPA